MEDAAPLVVEPGTGTVPQKSFGLQSEDCHDDNQPPREGGTEEEEYE